MTAVIVSCRDCGAPYAPERSDLVRGPSHYRTCPACRPVSTPPPADTGSVCRLLRDGKREVCLGCILGAPAL